MAPSLSRGSVGPIISPFGPSALDANRRFIPVPARFPSAEGGVNTAADVIENRRRGATSSDKENHVRRSRADRGVRHGGA
jgi:hypothetical protein